MVEDRYITQTQENQALNEPLHFKKQSELKAGHFVMYVKDLLVQKYGDAMVERGGSK